MTDAELTGVELQLGLPLPASYRAFMTRFGSGVLMDWVGLHSPLSVPRRDPGFIARTLRLRKVWLSQTLKYPRLFPNREFLCRCVYFASDCGGDAYVWDPQDSPDRNAHEYRLYRLQRHNEAHPVQVGESFTEFVAWVGEEMRTWRDREKLRALGKGIHFVPLYIRGKKPPLKRDAKLWLRANNNTVRDLALSIRDRGQTDAFPILGDALEEAGCSNADLLDSCRQGDPDIDGKWVLQVLLGKT